MADVKPSADGITEIRAFLRAPGSAAEAGGATVSGLLGRAQDSEVDQFPESEISAATRYIEFLLAHEAPVDADLLARIDRARDQPSPGISHSDVLREFGL